MTKNSKPEKVRVPLGVRSYDILAGSGLFSGSGHSAVPDALRRILEGRSVLLAADSNTGPLYGEKIRSSMESAGARFCRLFIFPAGESSKTLSGMEKICRAAAAAGLDRTSVIAALGGGVTGDMAAFAASVYMRGIDCVQIPTSFLAMIDSSVGGKTAVNLPEGKNLAGTFHQPRLVVIDLDFLDTLPVSERKNGFAELLKHAILFDPELFSILESSAPALLRLRDKPLLARLVARSCALKAEAVSNDEFENSTRALLNLGHTFGHALEKLRKFSGISHGEAVASGISAAVHLALKKKLLKTADFTRILNLLKAFDLPVSMRGFTPAQILEAMRGDKKNTAGRIRLVLPLKIGRCDLFPDVPDQEILAALEECCD